MLNSWMVIYLALAYAGALFAMAYLGDLIWRRRDQTRPRPAIYALSLGVYCTSWTFFGSVGLSARSGLDFLPVYIGPALLLVAGWPLLRKLVRISRRQNITSMADFISARYGKNQALGALVALGAMVGVVPYISLQLKAVSLSLSMLMPEISAAPGHLFFAHAGDEMAFFVTLAMAGFAMLFGTRHIDATEHQHGMILAIAVESVVKLLAFLGVGIFVVFWLMGGPSEFFHRMMRAPASVRVFTHEIDLTKWLTITLLSLFAFLLLPRQFHVAVVENTNEQDVRKAAWRFPLYLLAINLFVVPIAIAGIMVLGTGVDADAYVLALPLSSGHAGVALLAFIGGLSAATAMVIIETVALSIMACNNLVMPYILSRRPAGGVPYEDMGRVLLIIRRLAIAAVLALAYGYYRMAGTTEALAQTGLLSFAAVAQFAPALIGGLLWRKATAAGAMTGIAAGFVVWFYTLLLPSFSGTGWISASFVAHGPAGLAFLRPQGLFGLHLDPLAHGVAWSLGSNLMAWAGVSLLTRPTPAERMQAAAFMASESDASSTLSQWRAPVGVGQLLSTVARYLGHERTRRSFAQFAARHEIDLDPRARADIRLLRFAEHLLAAAVGAASSRLVMAMLLERVTDNREGALLLLDDASAAIQYNRDLLQSAIDHVRQGIAVFDHDYNLICWNRQFRHLLRLPPDMGRVGVPLDEILRKVLTTASFEGDPETALARRFASVTESFESYQERLEPDGTVLEVRASRMPDGGVVITFADITKRVLSAEALQMANELLERRVAERTAELTRLNSELARAKAAAEAANLDKTRFIAAASHDILQPLNAARLFTSALVEDSSGHADPALARNIDASLESVEEILTALLDISRLDAGAMTPEIARFPVDDILAPLAREMAPMARARGLKLRVVASSAWVRTDRRMLRRLLQNLLSNAIKYTTTGKVLLGCRLSGENLRVEVHDTGPGIPPDKHEVIFREFERLDGHAGKEPGLGLGLAIVERLSRMLECPLTMTSRSGRGTAFSILLPRASTGHVKKTAASRALGTGAARATAVLVIDNEPAILEGMQKLLGGWGCKVLCAATGARAAAILRSERVDAILADYHLDNEDGLEVIEMLRALTGEPLPAILITADRSARTQEKARHHDVICLHKPMKPAALRALLNQVCALRASAGA